MAYWQEILDQVTKPARYAAGEWNSIVKDWETTPVRIALAYPDLYEIGMSNLAIPILYDLLNGQPDVLAERVYAPWQDMEQALRRQALPLFSLESKHPLKEFDILGFSLGYELTFTNVLNMLDLAGIPVLARERPDGYPLIIAGGSAVLNPEPMADFIDLFVLGDGEEITLELLEVFRAWKREKAPKEELLRQAATIPGVYVPRFYQVSYHEDGTLASFSPTIPQASPRIQRRLVPRLPPPVTRPVVPNIEVVHDRGVVEIQRGCTRGCRFCQAGIIYRPVRERPPQEVMAAVAGLVRSCGYDEVSLLSLSTSDYPGIEGLVAELSRRFKEQSLAISLPSLRIDNFSIKLMESLTSRRKTGLTFAPEAGSERLRQAINKAVPEAAILDTVGAAFQRGWLGLKLYFMIGLPTETQEDVQSIAQLVGRVVERGRKETGKHPRVKVSLAPFVPKPHTAFQWAAQDSQEALAAKLDVLRAGLRKARASFSWTDPRVSLMEAVLSRGDRRLGGVIHHAWQQGCTFDAWSDRFSYERWLQALESCGLTPQFYALRERSPDELLPWAHVDVGVNPAYLKREYQRTLKGIETPDCRTTPCHACGIQERAISCQRRFEALLEKAPSQG